MDFENRQYSNSNSLLITGKIYTYKFTKGQITATKPLYKLKKLFGQNIKVRRWQ